MTPLVEDGYSKRQGKMSSRRRESDKSTDITIATIIIIEIETEIEKTATATSEGARMRTTDTTGAAERMMRKIDTGGEATTIIGGAQILHRTLDHLHPTAVDDRLLHMRGGEADHRLGTRAGGADPPLPTVAPLEAHLVSNKMAIAPGHHPAINKMATA